MPKNMFLLPAEAITDHTLHPSAVALLAALCLRLSPQETQRISIGELKEPSGLSFPTILPARNSLEKCGYIAIKRSSGKCTPHYFSFPPREDWVPLSRAGVEELLASSAPHMSVLLFLFLSIHSIYAPAEYSQRELANVLAVARSSVCRGMEYLEQGGYIRVERGLSKAGDPACNRYFVLR